MAAYLAEVSATDFRSPLNPPPTTASPKQWAPSDPLPTTSQVDTSRCCDLVTHPLELFDGGFGVVADSGLSLSLVPGI